MTHPEIITTVRLLVQFVTDTPTGTGKAISANGSGRYVKVDDGQN